PVMVARDLLRDDERTTVGQSASRVQEERLDSASQEGVVGQPVPRPLRSVSPGQPMGARAAAFWILLFAVLLALTAILREILLPFVVALALAYLLDPLATRLERLGLSRLMATLLILLLFFLGGSAVVWLVAPTVIRELSYFIDSAPRYLQQLQ